MSTPKQSLHEKLCRSYAASNRIFAVLFELTHRCPCRCTHCYLLKNPQKELSLAEIENLFVQLAAEGVIELALSGGEIFLRRDLPQILNLTTRHGFVMNIITTGILIGKKEAALLQANCCRKIELSLLGSCEATHDAIMAYPGAFAALRTAIGHLKAADIQIALKSTLMQQNYRELEAMATLAREWDVQFSASLSLAPREDKNTAPQTLAVTPEQIPASARKLLSGALIPLESSQIHANFVCRAGGTIAGISPEGEIYPCILMRESLGNIRKNTLSEIWHTKPLKFLEDLRKLTSEDVAECYTCQYNQCCPRCPGVVYMETGSLTAAAPSACRIARSFHSFSY